MKFGFLAGLDFMQRKAEDVVKALKENGYDGVEWTLAHFNPRAKSEKELTEVVRVTKDAGLEISELVVQQNYVNLEKEKNREAIDFTKECIQACAKFGIPAANVFTGPIPWDPSTPVVGKNIKEGDAWQMVRDAYAEIVPAAEKNKVNLAVEGVFGMLCHDFYTTSLLINHFRSEYLGVNLDPSHGILVGNLDVGWIVKEWGKRIKHVHLKDCAGTPGMGNFIFPLLGEGLVDWAAFFKALKEIGYNGFCSVEFESFTYYNKVLRNDPVAAAELSMEQIRKLTEGII